MSNKKYEPYGPKGKYGPKEANMYRYLNDIDKKHPMIAHYGMILCPEDSYWVDGYKKRDGSIVHGYCKKR